MCCRRVSVRRLRVRPRNKVCGSGLEAVLGVARAIAAGEIEVGIAGGMESMSNAPHILRNSRSGTKMGPLETADTMVTDGLWDPYSNQHMGNCAELCAKERNIPRSAQDEFAAESYKRALEANKNGSFKAEITPVEIADKKATIKFEVDEEPGRGNIEKLGSLRTAFPVSIRERTFAFLLLAVARRRPRGE